MKIISREEISLMDLLLRNFGTASKSKVRSLLKYGMIRVNGRIQTRGDVVLKEGDVVEYSKERPRDRNTPYPLIFEDNSILVSEKPAGVLTIGYPGKKQGDTSFYKEWLTYIKERSQGRDRIFIVHRLDKEVSGLIIFAMDEKIQEQLKGNWHTNVKLYYALVEGRPPASEGTVRSYLEEGPKEIVRSTRDTAKGKLAITHYRVIRELPEHTLLEIRLETGRKNQVRVHMKELGCPITGDRRYGSRDPYQRKIRLHAFHLELRHPVTGELLKFETRLPKGFTILAPHDEKYK